MATSLLKNLFFVLLLGACSSARNSNKTEATNTVNTDNFPQPEITDSAKPKSLMDLPQTQYGGFVLKPGFYEAEFKTYCLQPGTPDPAPGDAYLQGPVTGYRKDIIESVLLNSRDKQDINQRNIQLLLWSVVSGSDFNKLSYAVQADAMRLLSPKQVFELKGGIMGAIKTVSNTSGILNANRDMKRLFETGMGSYETFERLAVRKEPSKNLKKGIKYDQWYREQENYFIRYFPVSYQKVRIQVFVPDSLLDAEGKRDGGYVVFDPTGKQAIPAFTNAQRLGIGAPVLDMIRVIIQVNKQPNPPKKLPEKQKNPKAGI